MKILIGSEQYRFAAWNVMSTRYIGKNIFSRYTDKHLIALDGVDKENIILFSPTLYACTFLINDLIGRRTRRI